MVTIGFASPYSSGHSLPPFPSTYHTVETWYASIELWSIDDSFSGVLGFTLSERSVCCPFNWFSFYTTYCCSSSFFFSSAFPFLVASASFPSLNAPQVTWQPICIPSKEPSLIFTICALHRHFDFFSFTDNVIVSRFYSFIESWEILKACYDSEG